jgi:hypothetical protein
MTDTDIVYTNITTCLRNKYSCGHGILGRQIYVSSKNVNVSHALLSL